MYALVSLILSWCLRQLQQSAVVVCGPLKDKSGTLDIVVVYDTQDGQHAMSLRDLSQFESSRTCTHFSSFECYPHEMTGDAGRGLGRPLAEMQDLVCQDTARHDQSRSRRLRSYACRLPFQSCTEVPEIGALLVHFLFSKHAMV